MKNSWKWILGISLIGVLAAGLFGLGFIHHTHMMAQHKVAKMQDWQSPMARGGDFHHGPAHGMMKMHGFGRGPLHGGMFFGKLGGIIVLGLGLLLLYGVYQLGVRKNAPVAPPVTPAPPAALPATHPCPSCGGNVQDGWNHCPNCGEKQTT